MELRLTPSTARRAPASCRFVRVHGIRPSISIVFACPLVTDLTASILRQQLLYFASGFDQDAQHTLVVRLPSRSCICHSLRFPFLPFALRADMLTCSSCPDRLSPFSLLLSPPGLLPDQHLTSNPPLLSLSSSVIQRNPQVTDVDGTKLDLDYIQVVGPKECAPRPFSDMTFDLIFWRALIPTPCPSVLQLHANPPHRGHLGRRRFSRSHRRRSGRLDLVCREAWSWEARCLRALSLSPSLPPLDSRRAADADLLVCDPARFASSSKRATTRSTSFRSSCFHIYGRLLPALAPVLLSSSPLLCSSCLFSRIDGCLHLSF